MTLDIPAVGAAGTGYATKINALLESLGLPASGGPVGDGVADDLAAWQDIFDAATGQFIRVPRPPVAYRMTDTLVMPAASPTYPGGTVDFNGAIILSEVTNGPALRWTDEARNVGELIIDCQSGIGSRGVDVGDGISAVRHGALGRIRVYNPDGPGFRFYAATAATNVHTMDADALTVRYGNDRGLEFITDAGQTYSVNAMRLGWVSVENCDGDAVYLDGSDSIQIGFLKAEGNGGYGLNINRAHGFKLGSGHLEGNNGGGTGQEIRVADYDAGANLGVGGDVYIEAGFDGNYASVVNVAGTLSGSRSVEVVQKNTKNRRSLDWRGMAYLELGSFGLAAEDQNVAVPLSVSRGLNLFRRSAVDPWSEIVLAGTDHSFRLGRGSGGERIELLTEAATAANETVLLIRRNVGGTFSMAKVLQGAQGTGPGGGTTRALYLAT